MIGKMPGQGNRPRNKPYPTDASIAETFKAVDPAALRRWNGNSIGSIGEQLWNSFPPKCRLFLIVRPLYATDVSAAKAVGLMPKYISSLKRDDPRFARMVEQRKSHGRQILRQVFSDVMITALKRMIEELQSPDITVDSALKIFKVMQPLVGHMAKTEPKAKKSREKPDDKPDIVPIKPSWNKAESA